MNKMTNKRLDCLLIIAKLDDPFYHQVKDKRSMMWLDRNGFVSVGFSLKHLTICVKLTEKGKVTAEELK